MELQRHALGRQTNIAFTEDAAHAARVTLLGELSAAIVHEVNQPLSALLNYAAAADNVLADDATNIAQARQYLEKIATQARRAVELVDRVQDLSRRRITERRCIDLDTVIDDALTLTHHLLGKQGAKIVRSRSCQRIEVLGDPVQLQQVMINLLVNAAQAMASTGGGNIRVGVLKGRQSAFLTVSDDGPGIPSGAEDEIFDSFKTSKPSGTGMGLAICRSIVELHGGAITAANNHDGGAMFRFALPLAEWEIVS